MLHGVVALREADRRVALHRHGDRRPHGARQRDLNHRQPVRRQPGPARKDIDVCIRVYSYSLCISRLLLITAQGAIQLWGEVTSPPGGEVN